MTRFRATLSALALTFAASTHGDVVRDVDNATKSPIQFGLCNFAIQNSCSSSAQTVFNVPSDRRLVIEFVSGNCTTVGSIQAFSVGTASTAGGFGAFHLLDLVFAPFSNTILRVSQQTRIYADPGSTVSVALSGTFGAGASATCTLVYSGHTVAP
jgi:hypothetical protein